jgi:hypothetical protein
VSATAGQAQGERGLAERLGLKQGQLVQEVGWDEDADNDLRDSIEELTGNELVDEDFEDVVDVVLLWWRDDDGDLFDALSEALPNLSGGGQIWLLTPKVGREGHVEPSDIEDNAKTAGLSSAKSISAAPDWSGTKLSTPKTRR